MFQLCTFLGVTTSNKISILLKTVGSTMNAQGSSDIMIDCFCGMVDDEKRLASQDHRQRSSPLRICENSRAGFESAHHLTSGLVQ